MAHPLPDRIHILGASGSGTTTLAAAVAARHDHRHLDTDDFYWLATDPPFSDAAAPGGDARSAVHRSRRVVGVGPVRFVVRLGRSGHPALPADSVPRRPDRRSDATLRARELTRYGHEAIAPGGGLHQAHVTFLEWAARYDHADVTERSRALHEDWLAAMPVPVVRLEGDRSVAAQLAALEAAVAAEGIAR